MLYMENPRADSSAAGYLRIVATAEETIRACFVGEDLPTAAVQVLKRARLAANQPDKAGWASASEALDGAVALYLADAEIKASGWSPEDDEEFLDELLNGDDEDEDDGPEPWQGEDDNPEPWRG